MSTLAEDHATLPWYAIRVRSNFEKTTSACLRGRGLDEYLPVYQQRNRWCDRVKVVDVPLFPGYLFCRFNIENRLPVLSSPGVVSIIGFGHNFLPVPDAEIDAIRTALASGNAVFPWPYLQAGQRVRIERGSMSGLEGILLRVRDNFRLVRSIPLLMRSVAVEVDRDWVRPL
jgi:transcription antitermination factor NusG